MWHDVCRECGEWSESGPRAHGFIPALWTRDFLRQLIARRFDGAYTIARVGVIMREMGLSPQRPVYHAMQQDEARVAAWRALAVPVSCGSVTFTTLLARHSPGSSSIPTLWPDSSEIRILLSATFNIINMTHGKAYTYAT